MKTIYNILLGTIFFASFMFLTSCNGNFGSDIAAGAHKTHKIDLEVSTDGSKLVISTFPIGKCKGANRKNGCIVIPHNKTATITFELHTKKWRLTEFRICQGITKPGECKLESWQEREFAVALKKRGDKHRPDSEGVVNLEKLSPNSIKKFMLHDYNGEVQDYFYSITACPGPNSPSKDCISTDPAIQNKGRN